MSKAKGKAVQQPTLTPGASVNSDAEAYRAGTLDDFYASEQLLTSYAF